MLDRLLRRIGKGRISAAERYRRKLREEGGFLYEDMPAAKGEEEPDERQKPKPAPDQCLLREFPQRTGRRLPQNCCCTIPLNGMAQATGDSRQQHDERKRQFQKRYRNECYDRHTIGKTRRQCPSGHAIERLKDHGQHRSLEAEQQSRHNINMPEGDIKRRQCQHDDRTGQHEQKPGQQAAAPAFHRPAGISRKLHGFRPRQQHAEIERMDQPLLIHPFLFIHENALQHGDLRRRAAEGQKPDLAECREKFFEIRLLYWLCHAVILNDPTKLLLTIITGS